MVPKQRLVVVDGNALIHRSFHALPPLTTKSGEVVNAVYGFATVVLKMLKDLKPTHVVVTFDMPGKTFRDEMYSEYKATRVKAPDDLYSQIPRVHELVKSFHIPIFEKSGFEADDLIGTITKRAQGIEKVIVTGDMDTLQLIDDTTSVYTLRKGIGDTTVLDVAAVKERYGITPNQLVDYKALRGDPSDNIPGVKGIGEKTASDLLQTFGTIEKLYEALKKETPKAIKLPASVREKLRVGESNAKLSKQLATIVRDVPIEFELSAAARKHYDRGRVVQYLQELGFSSLLSKIPQNEVEDGARTPTAVQGALQMSAPVTPKKGQDYELIASTDAFREFVKRLKLQSAFTFDTETTSLDPLQATILGISFSWETGSAYFVSLQRGWLEQLKPIFENSEIEKHGHNLKYDLGVLATSGVHVAGRLFDTMIASYLLNPGSRAHGLDQIVFEEFGYEMMPIEKLIGPRGKKQLPMETVPVDRLSWYSCEDADYTERLFDRLSKKLHSDLRRVMDEIDMPLVPVLERMERNGVKLDSGLLRDISRELGGQLKKLEASIIKLAGHDFNVASPGQLKTVLFDELKLPTKGIGKTKTGLSTAADQLEKLRGTHPIIEKIMEIRELSKLKSTYLDALPELVSPVDRRLHTSFNQTVAATGRLSSSDPNLQNIPIRTELGATIRNAFVAERGQRILKADYSQFELRIAASVANVQAMIKAFRAGEDIHTATAALMHNLPLEKVTKEIRRTAKEVNFGVLYGMGASGLAQRQGISREKAQEFIDMYFSAYHELAEWIEVTIALARKQGYVETMFGRRRYLPELNASNPMLRAAAERMAMNMPIQGTQADLIKKAMIQVDALLPKLSPAAKMILQVHDELVFEVPESDVEKVARMVKREMQDVAKLKVPIVVEVEVGKNWGQTELLKI